MQGVLPWSLVASLAVVAAGGAILTMSGWDQREPRRTEAVGRWILGLSLAAAVSVAGVNVLVYIANGIGTVMQQSFASAAQRPTPNE